MKENKAIKSFTVGICLIMGFVFGVRPAIAEWTFTPATNSLAYWEFAANDVEPLPKGVDERVRVSALLGTEPSAMSFLRATYSYNIDDYVMNTMKYFIWHAESPATVTWGITDYENQQAEGQVPSLRYRPAANSYRGDFRHSTVATIRVKWGWTLDLTSIAFDMSTGPKTDMGGCNIDYRINDGITNYVGYVELYNPDMSQRWAKFTFDLSEIPELQELSGNDVVEIRFGFYWIKGDIAKCSPYFSYPEIRGTVNVAPRRPTAIIVR